MGLLELCLLSLLSPQAPTAGPAPAPAPATAPAIQGANDPMARSPGTQEPAGDHAAELAALKAAEATGATADVEQLTRLATGGDAGIAARAAWLLGRSKDPGATAALGQAFASPHAAARLQVMAALQQRGDASAFPIATKALDDDDRSVRAIAAQVLGKLRRPQSAGPLLALLDRARSAATAGPAIDLQAAVLALHDIGALDQLLAVATAIHGGKATGLGEALAYYFQDYSPQLAPNDETTLLLAVLDHREPLLRRYAIGRLTALGGTSVITALERHLGNEGDELRPLVEAALTQLRAPETPPEQDTLTKARQTFDGLLARAKTAWAGLDDNRRYLVGSSPLVLILLVVVIGKLKKRRRSATSAAATAALVAPSDEYLAEQAEAAAIEAEAAVAAGEAAAYEADTVEPQLGDATAGDGDGDGWEAVTEEATAFQDENAR